MPSRVQSEELNIEHVGHPGQGMPVCGITARKCPPNGLHGHAVPDMDIFGYIRGIVIINEIAPVHLPECYKRGSRQENANRQDLFAC